MNPETQQNVMFYGKIAAVGFIGYKLLQKLGIIKTAEDAANDKAAKTLDDGAAASPAKVNPQNPSLALNPKYWLSIFKLYQKQTKKANLTIAEITKLLQSDYTNGKGYNVNLAAAADQIWNAKSVKILPDQEDAALGVFRALRSQAQISKMSDLFNDNYKRDLLGYLQSFNNSEQLAKIYAVVKNKPLW